MRRILAGTLIAWVLPATAHAATVSSTQHLYSDDHGPIAVQEVDYTAAPGEANRLELSLEGMYGVRLHDAVPITPVAPCVAVDAQTAVCPPRGSLSVQAKLGDGADTATSAFTAGGVDFVTVDAGDGDDAINIPGGVVSGGPGDDTLTGASVMGGPGADTMQGGTLDYSDHTAGVTVDLAGGIAGAPGENDHIVLGFTWVTGGSGPDVIRAADRSIDVYGGPGDDMIEGSPQYDRIEAGAGNDVVRGAGGGDELFGGDGNDRLEGGDGKDYLLGDAGDDVLEGGPGRDELSGDIGADTLLARDGTRDVVECEDTYPPPQRLADDRADIDTADADSECDHVTGARRLVVHALVRRGVHGLALIVSCAARRTCGGRVTIKGEWRRQRVSGARTLRVAPGRRMRVPIRLNRRVTAAKYDFDATVVTRAGRTLRADLLARHL